MRKDKCIFCLCLLAIIVSLTACNEKTQKPVEITIIHGWGSMESDHVAMRNIYQDFQKENTDVKVRLISMPTSEEVVRKVEDMVMTGEIPDVIFFSGVGRNSIYQYMVKNNLALDLMPYIEEDETLAENIAPANLQYWLNERNQLFSVSDALQLCGGYWYDESIFEQAGIKDLPETWDEFEKTCEMIKLWADERQNGVLPLQVPAEGYLYFTDHMMAVNGGKCQDAIWNNKILIKDEELALIMEELKKIHTFSEETDEMYSYRDATGLFNEGKIAIYINGVWGAPMIAEDKNVKYALLPSNETGGLACESAYLGYVLGNTTDPMKKEASVRFLKYMLSEEVQERILRETEQVPANPKINLEDYEQEMPRFYQAVKTVQSAEKKIEAPRNLWEYPRDNVFEEYILDVLAGNMNRQTFFDLLK